MKEDDLTLDQFSKKTLDGKIKGGKNAGIKWHVLMHVAYRNLDHKKMRTLLTITGVVIGIGAVYFLLSFGLGLQKLVTDEIIGNQSIKLVEVYSTNSEIINLDQEMISDIQGLPYVTQTSTEYSSPGIIAYNGAEIDTVTYGVDRQYFEMVQLDLVAGDFLTDDAAGSHGVVVNTTALDSLGVKNYNSAIGMVLPIRVPLKLSDGSKAEINNNFKIAGVVDSGSGGEIFMHGGIFAATGVDNVDQLRILAEDTSRVKLLREQIESMGLETQSPIDTLDQVNQVFNFFNVIMVSFGSIGMLVSIVGMFNTVTVSFLERTKETALMIALGARRQDMRNLFILETMLISLIGACIGIVLAALAGGVLNLVMNILAARRGLDESFSLFAHPAWLILGTIVLMLGVGLLVAMLPSKRAQKIEPIESLRRD